MTKMPELMMLAPYFLKMSDIEDIVNAVNLGNVDRETIRKDLAHVFDSFRHTLDAEKKRQDELKQMIACVDSVCERSNSLISTMAEHGCFSVAALRYGAKKHLLKEEHDPRRVAEIAFNPSAGHELARFQSSKLADFVAFVNDVYLAMLEDHGSLTSKPTSDTYRRSRSVITDRGWRTVLQMQKLDTEGAKLHRRHNRSHRRLKERHNTHVHTPLCWVVGHIFYTLVVYICLLKYWARGRNEAGAYPIVHRKPLHKTEAAGQVIDKCHVAAYPIFTEPRLDLLTMKTAYTRKDGGQDVIVDLDFSEVTLMWLMRSGLSRCPRVI